MAVDTTIQFNNHNSYKITADLFCYPFGVQDMAYITHSFQAYATSALSSATRANTKFLAADGSLISESSHALAVTTVFGKIEITVAVPATATQAQLVLLQAGTDWWIAEPKSEQGESATPYNVNYAGQLTYITPNGIYTGMITTSQIVVTGSVGLPDETLDTRLVTISNGQINLSSTVTAKTTKITNEGVYTGDIVATQITSGYIDSDRIAAGTITASKIAAGTITGDKIAAGTITADKINVTNLYVDTMRGSASTSSYVKFALAASWDQMTFYSENVPRGSIRTYLSTAIIFDGDTSNVSTVRVRHGDASFIAWNGASASIGLGDNRLGVDSTGFYKEVSGSRTYF